MLHKIFAAASLLCCLIALSFAPMSETFAADQPKTEEQKVQEQKAEQPKTEERKAGPISADEAAHHIAKVAKHEFTEEGFLSAAYDFCATVQNRTAKSCECEQKLLKDPDRFGAEEREMAFYYFTDKDRYLKEFTSRIKADPKWQEGFALRMSNMQALIIAACGA